jgi:hypothetical protein
MKKLLSKQTISIPGKTSVADSDHFEARIRIRVSQKTKILGAQVFPILLCPKSPNMTIKFFSVFIKRYMSNLEIVILRL